MTAPLVSICLPVYNGERYLAGCLESALAQTFRDFELLVVNDASRDATPAIAREYAARDPRVRVADNPRNLGLVGNWNRCVELARGKWIKFLFHDDRLDADCLAHLVSAAGPDDAFVACKRRLEFDGEPPAAMRAFYARHQQVMDQTFALGPRLSAAQCQALAIDRFNWNCFGEPTSVLLSRDAVLMLGPFDPLLICICDFEYWVRISIHHGAVLVPKELATFRVHPDTATAAAQKRRFRMDILERVVLMHHYAFDPHYEPLRRAAAARTPPVDFAASFAELCEEANERATLAARDGDMSACNELEQVAGVHPEVLGHFGRRVGWRLRSRMWRLQGRLAANRAAR